MTERYIYRNERRQWKHVVKVKVDGVTYDGNFLGITDGRDEYVYWRMGGATVFGEFRKGKRHGSFKVITVRNGLVWEGHYKKGVRIRD